MPSITPEDRVAKLEQEVGINLLYGTKYISLVERVSRLEALTNVLGITLDGIGQQPGSNPVNLGGWKVDLNSIFAKGGTTTDIVDMVSTDPLITVTQPDLGTTVFEDTFTAANGTAIAGRTPDTGNAWDTQSTSTLKIQDNEMEYQGGSTGSAWAVIDRVNYKISFDWTMPAEGTVTSIDALEFFLRVRFDQFGLPDLTSNEWVSIKFDPKAGADNDIVISYNDGSPVGTVDIFIPYEDWNYGGVNSFRAEIVGDVVKIWRVIGASETLLLTSNPLPWATDSDSFAVYFRNLLSTEGWSLDNLKIEEANVIRFQFGKVDTGTQDYGIRAWDSTGEKFIDEEGVIASATDIVDAGSYYTTDNVEAALQQIGPLTGMAALTPTDGNFIVGDGTDWVVESGATARASMGVTIGTDVQAWDADLDAIAALANTDSNFIVGNGSTWVVESGATARTSLGLTIGTDVQAWDDDLDDIAALTPTDSNFIVGDGTNWVKEDAATARTSLGLGTIATQNANAIAITGGTITGITDFKWTEFMYHDGDIDTYIQAQDDRLDMYAGGLQMLSLVETTQDVITLGPGSGDVDIDFNGDMFLQGSDGFLGISVTPSTRLDIGAGAMEFDEMTAPSAGAVNTGRLFCRDNGAGKTQLCVIFNTGAIQVIATEP